MATSLTLAALLALGLPMSVQAQVTKQPVYVGAQTCATCHDGDRAGHQYSKWLLTKHSRAWAALAKPEAKEMARLSGIPDEPTKAPVCLGCHATAWDVEPWQRDPTFHMEDGIQCERCHGPGSDYSDEATMRDRTAAMKAGLRVMTKRDCQVCHYVKGSHVAVHRLPALDVDKAWDEIAHPLPKASARARPSSFPRAPAEAKGPKLVGSLACAKCHREPERGHQYNLWRLSPHSRAFAVLSTEKAAEMATQGGGLR